ncbi:mannose-1-phosphate guanylyltransferase [Chitinophaga costaii]|uniref:mannose-1-phosphate guanylyltransferase n=1 Tax=Chitinophaga costaii TaxID=1335309 RepID=A0A1C4AG45_9BACT|nr:mannose-1-phosphate guanylyltransferase [Chitinophaga costaii]PUZ26592.1 mannose-1-phosphate guanylyltransferase [Chitinophaga costaii]SCB93570.1 mannose-1-phosphate guanylyltransferase [Chitinophaga costaii]
MTHINKHYYVAIMAGGIGSRFWPYSRTDLPKQFLDMLNTGKTLLQWTYERFLTLIPAENIFVVTHEQYADLVAQQLPVLPAENIVAEPSRKNTAPCVAYISHKIHKLDPKASIICAPADHLILDPVAFVNSCLIGLQFVENHSALVTLGIQPTRPDTGYGYIQFETQQVADNVYPVKTFTEKPSLDIARTFLESGDFLWNAGIFVWQSKTILAALKKYLPEVDELFVAEEEALNTPQEQNVIEMIYAQCTNISIDYGIMEKADNVYVIPSNFGWSDLGTWASAYDNLEKDYLGNAVQGKNVMVIDATNSMVKAPHDKLVLLQGLDDFIIIDTPDVLLICKKDKEQQIKEYVAEVKRHKGDRFL